MAKAFEEVRRSAYLKKPRELHYFSRFFRSAKRQRKKEGQFDTAAQTSETLQIVTNDSTRSWWKGHLINALYSAHQKSNARNCFFGKSVTSNFSFWSSGNAVSTRMRSIFSDSSDVRAPRSRPARTSALRVISTSIL